MSTYYWIGGDGGNEGDFATLANWQDSAGSTPASLPGAGDDLVFDGRAGEVTADLANSGGQGAEGEHWSVTDSLDRNVNFNSITILGDFRGNVGWYDSSTETYYRLACGANKIDVMGDGVFYFAAKSDNIDELNVFGDCVVDVTVEATENVGEVDIHSGEATLDIPINNTVKVFGGLGVFEQSVETVYQYGGTVYFIDDITTYELIDGSAYAGMLSTPSSESATISTLKVHGGSFEWMIAGQISNLTINGGTFKSVGYAEKTLGDGTNVVAVNAGTLNLAEGENLTLSSGTTVECVGTVIPPARKQISW